MMTTKKRKNMLGVLAAAVMLMTVLLTACGSGQEAVTSTQTEASKVETETAKAEETAPAAPTETKETETTAEPIESTPEPVVYEGIDMESTLPGVDWMDTFDGIINEPKIVIFNDETNKKMIVENGQEVEFTEEDTLAFYLPTNMELYISEGQNDFEIFNDMTAIRKYTLFTGLFTLVSDGDIIPLKYDFSGDGNYTLTVTLIAKKGK